MIDVHALHEKIKIKMLIDVLRFIKWKYRFILKALYTAVHVGCIPTSLFRGEGSF